jgi:hypothetical protein
MVFLRSAGLRISSRLDTLNSSIVTTRFCYGGTVKRDYTFSGTTYGLR